MTFQGFSQPPTPCFPSAVSHYPNYHSGFLFHSSDAQQALRVPLQSSCPEIISVLGTQHYRQQWRRVSTLRAAKTNRVCSDLTFDAGCFLWVFFFCVFCVQTDLPAVPCGWRCVVEGGLSGRAGVCSRIHTSVPPPPSSLFLSMQNTKA